MTNLSKLKMQFRDGSLSKPNFIQEALKVHSSLFDYVDVTRTTDVKEILITEDGVQFVLGDDRIRLYCPENEARVAPLEIMNFDHYEPEETRVMDLLAVNTRNILDVGANIGWYSIRFAKRFPNAKVFAFEPMPTSHAFLQRNVSANSVGGRVICFNYGLSATGGAAEFFVAPAGGVNASLKNVANANDAVPIVGLTLTLDQWVDNHRILPDFIKCDVEGAELLVFRGGQATVARHRPIVFAELLRKWAKPFGYHPNDMLGFFANLGYQCFAVGVAGARRIAEVTDETLETNYAFLHGETHCEAIKTLEASASRATKSVTSHAQ
jgi:FkbM family methyltransferase